MTRQSGRQGWLGRRRSLSQKTFWRWVECDQAENHIGTNEIDIVAMQPRRLDAMAYVCFAVAKDIITGSKTVSITELADASMLSPRYFLVIQTAMLIRGYGLSAANRLMFTEGRKSE